MRRIDWIDFGKGFTIFFVLVAHTFSGIYATNLFKNYDYITNPALIITYIFIMPCFFALSGFLYKEPSSLSAYITNIKKKALSLLIPYVIFSFIYVFLQHLTTANNLNKWNSLISIYKQPIGYLWFLYALFFIFIVIGILNLLHISQNCQIIIYIIMFFVAQYIKLPYFIQITFNWIPCFYIGILLNKYEFLTKNKIIIIISSVLSITILIFQGYQHNGIFDANGMNMISFLPKLLCIIPIFYFFINIKRTTLYQYFSHWGRYSMIIYLVHAPAESVFRTILLKLGVSNYFILLIGTIFITWYFSILICYLSQKIKFLKMIFYPLKIKWGISINK